MTMHDGVAAVLHALSDPGRVRILEHLMTGEHRVRDLTEHLHLAQSTVSAHLACLRDCGLVASRPEGRASKFSIVDAAGVRAVLDATARLAAPLAVDGEHTHTDDTA